MKVFLERNKRTLFVTSIIMTFVLVAAGGILRNILRPRVTRGFTPEKVVETFFNSMTEMDDITMTDCVFGDAGKIYIDETIYTSLLSKQFIAAEQKTYIIPANIWAEAGKPVLNPPYWVFGVVNLQIEQTEYPPEPVFLVTYEKWARANEDSPVRKDGIVYEGWNITDKVHMRQYREYWVIHKIDRVDGQPIPNK